MCRLLCALSFMLKCHPILGIIVKRRPCYANCISTFFQQITYSPPRWQIHQPDGENPSSLACITKHINKTQQINKQKQKQPTNFMRIYTNISKPSISLLHSLGIHYPPGLFSSTPVQVSRNMRPSCNLRGAQKTSSVPHC
jgi:hypothetical protein